MSLVAAIAVSPNVAFADTAGTTEISNNANGQSIGSFGGNGATPTYGQVFTAPLTGKLTSFQLSLNGGVGSLSGGVGTWNGGSTYGAGYGSPTNLYLSSPVASTVAGVYDFVTNIDVTAGNQYVAYLTTYGNELSTSSTLMPMGSAATGINYFVFNNSGSAVGNASWDYFLNVADYFPNTGGALFSATFSDAAVGAPEIDGGKLPLVIMLLGLLFLISKRNRQGKLAAS